MNFILSLISPTSIKWISILLIVLISATSIFISYNNRLQSEIQKIEQKYQMKELDNKLKLQKEKNRILLQIEKFKQDSVESQTKEINNINKKDNVIKKTINHNLNKPASKLFRDLFKELETTYGEK